MAAQWDTHIALKKAELECNQTSRAHFQFQEIQVREKHNPHKKTDPCRMWGILASGYGKEVRPLGAVPD